MEIQPEMKFKLEFEVVQRMTDPNDQAIDWTVALEQHRPWLQKVLRCRVGDQHEVDDLFQEIALAVFRQSKPTHKNGTPKTTSVPSDPEKVAPWLYRLAVRQAVNFHRRTNRKSQAKPTPELNPFSPDPQPLDWMLAKEQKSNLRKALAQLRPQEREVLTLKYTENWTYDKMAEHLGVPVRTIEYRLLNARKKLRQHLTRLGTAHSAAT
jgi:RNA polymerase sigma-70 factor (ECF subfamily)